MPLQLFTLKALLNTFANFTGLKVNYAKSSLYPINISQERLKHLTATFQCKQGGLTFTYLGLPLSMNKPSMQDYLPLVGRVERRLVSTSMLLSQGAKLQLVNSVLSSLVTLYICSIKVPITIIKQVEKYRMHCLWRGSDMNAKKPPMSAWKMVTKPKNRGGLGVINLRLQNDVLLMKNLDKFFNKADLPWVKLVWQNYYKNGQLLGRRKRGSFWGGEYCKILRLI
jgi:hypothetical protein